MNAIDLFSGAGGLSLGLEQAGINCLAGVDIDSDSMETFANSHPDALAICSDVVDAIANELSSFKKGRRQSSPLILAGGPPCQGFCSINPGRHIDDPRNSCVDTFLHACAELNPDFVLMENVTGLLSLAKGEAIKKIVKVLNDLNYFVDYMVLQAAHYGAPQSRWRLIITGSKRGKFNFPIPTHFSDIKPNVAGGKTLTFKTTDQDLFQNYLPPTTVWDAISDLPKLSNGGGSLQSRINLKAKTEFQKLVRNSSTILYNHQAQNLGELNLRRIECIKEGENWQALPRELVPQNIKNSAEKWGRYTPTRFGRLKKIGQFTTILTKPEPYWGSFIHPTQNRLISAREAARAQCFADKIKFYGSLSSQYRQIGNAVPLCIGRVLGEAIKKHLSGLDDG